MECYDARSYALGYSPVVLRQDLESHGAHQDELGAMIFRELGKLVEVVEFREELRVVIFL